jgi:hypothetical protein
VSDAKQREKRAQHHGSRHVLACDDHADAIRAQRPDVSKHSGDLYARTLDHAEPRSDIRCTNAYAII